MDFLWLVAPDATQSTLSAVSDYVGAPINATIMARTSLGQPATASTTTWTVLFSAPAPGVPVNVTATAAPELGPGMYRASTVATGVGAWTVSASFVDGGLSGTLGPVTTNVTWNPAGTSSSHVWGFAFQAHISRRMWDAR